MSELPRLRADVIVAAIYAVRRGTLEKESFDPPLNALIAAAREGAVREAVERMSPVAMVRLQSLEPVVAVRDGMTWLPTGPIVAFRAVLLNALLTALGAKP